MRLADIAVSRPSVYASGDDPKADAPQPCDPKRRRPIGRGPHGVILETELVATDELGVPRAPAIPPRCVTVIPLNPATPPALKPSDFQAGLRSIFTPAVEKSRSARVRARLHRDATV